MSAAAFTTGELVRIGELAAEIGVSTRTLRYYEEIGLLRPSAHTAGGSRRYGQVDRERLLRIRDLQSVMGFNLEEIRQILAADDRLAELKTEYARGVTPKRHRDILVEAARLNSQTQARVLAKVDVLDGYLAELREQASRYKRRAVELGVTLPPDAS